MPHTPAAHYRMFGHYNAWANGRLYEAAARLSPEPYRADRGAFFKSVHGTLRRLAPRGFGPCRS
ncbi:DinB family protein [Bradyrhizobium sp.]|uniref:DinB family protein n=1 Tax=Bradyrhizobium sp. TaxID=376 RepID=UPI003C72A7E4